MAEFEQTITIDAPSDEVFAFVSNLNNLPKYLPIKARSDAQTSERPRMPAGHNDKFSDPDGWLRVDPTEYMLEWSADTDRHYTGWLEVEDHHDRCDVTVHLSFRPRTPSVNRNADDGSRFESVVDDGLRSTLESIKRILEGRFANLQPSGVR